ncbi:hypothetical protein [Sulfuricystis multivorans]|uniref:hypothetical protein n=1 Tax=Sulfuricystis multivorans TaxID=2211108 RepID=UPI000F844D17|nr:hypothetical protein [Sulfuricystis multivorans]
MELKRISLSINDESSKPESPSRDDFVMAWAVDVETGRPRYILELDRVAQKGKRCNCKCPNCNLPLTAVNAGKITGKRRPHFRHPKGAAREKCIIVAARRAIDAMFGRQERIVLPRRRRSREVEGLSGRYHDAWVERPAETICISDCSFEDEANAILKLDDGRRLHVRLVGRGEVASGPRNADRLMAHIEIQADDPEVANMNPEEILARLELAWNTGCWVNHWADNELDAEAEALAIVKAIDALDWLDAGDLPDDLSPSERRETLLHREVKAILERERRIRVPELKTVAEWHRASGFIDKRTWSSSDRELQLSSVNLEVHLGHSVPDVVASWVEEDGFSHSLLIEVTVTNPISDERIERLASIGWPVLEIDISRMGGNVTRDELARLVLDEVAGKRWLYHPTIEKERTHLLAVMQQEEAQAIETERQRQAILDVSAAEWGKRYLDAFRRRWHEKQQAFGKGLLETDGWRQAQLDVAIALNGLAAHGYPASILDEYPLRTVIARILSIRDGTGIEYRTDVWGVINAIRCDGKHARQWHTLYLIALKIWPPDLTESQQKKVDDWRHEVVESIRSGKNVYVRETIYDRLLGLLFPDMREALANPFGTPLYNVQDDDFDDLILAKRSTRIHAAKLNHHQTQSKDVATVFVDYDPFENHPWAQDAEKKQLLQAASAAAKRGLNPGSFAQTYNSSIQILDGIRVLRLLIEAGLAKTQYEWSWEWDRNWVCKWK